MSRETTYPFVQLLQQELADYVFLEFNIRGNWQRSRKVYTYAAAEHLIPKYAREGATVRAVPVVAVRVQTS